MSEVVLSVLFVHRIVWAVWFFCLVCSCLLLCCFSFCMWGVFSPFLSVGVLFCVLYICFLWLY